VIALFPLAIILLGTGDGEKVTLIGFACFWPVLLATVDGVRGVDPAKLDVSHSFRLGRAMTLWRVVLPAAAPQVAGGIRTATSVGLVTMLGSELYAADRGIGYFVLQSQREFSIVDMWAGLLLLGMLGYLINLLVGIAEHRLLSWHRSMREFESRRLHA
jgi:ABC-type nitrate/sulfonate/bicarbonate transport system permease component